MPQFQPQQYRLRLTEGTQLVVDHDALGSWLADEKALVQPPGSQRWRLLRQFLADEREGITHAPQAPTAPRPLPLVPPPPRRPRLSKGESARAEGVVWADGGPTADPPPPSAPAPPEDDIFGPDLSDTEGDSPWEWPQEPEAEPGPEPEPPRAASAASTDCVAATAGPEIVEPEFPDFEFPNDDVLTLDDLVAPASTPLRGVPCTDSEQVQAPAPPAVSEAAEAVALAASGDTLASVLDEAPVDARPALLDEPALQDTLLADLTESFPPRAPSAVQVLADVLTAGPTTASDRIAPIPLKPLDPEPARALPPAELTPAEEPVESVEWGPGLLGWFCCTVADWSDRIAGWIDRGKGVAAHRDEYQQRVTSGVRQVGPRLRARLDAVPDETRTLVAAWRELISGWLQRLRR